MRNIKTTMLPLIPILFISSFLFSQVRVEGYCHLEGTSDHQGTKVKFNPISPGTMLDSCYTDSDGFYSDTLPTGLYDIQYTHTGFDYDLARFRVEPDNYLLDSVYLEKGFPAKYSGLIDGVWTPEIIYHIVGDVTVTDTLIIEKGVRIRFDGEYLFKLHDVVIAEGTKDSSITFNSTYKDIYWKGIEFWIYPDEKVFNFTYVNFLNSEDGLNFTGSHPVIFLRHCNFGMTEGNPRQGYINCQAAYVRITNSNIFNCYGVRVKRFSDVYLYNNVFRENEYYHIWSEALRSGDHLIVSNNVFDGSYGVLMEEGGMNPHVDIANNIFIDNTILFHNIYPAYPFRYNLILNYDSIVSYDTLIGKIDTMNNQGTPSDAYMNLFVDPDFVSNDRLAFLPGTSSPAIDAGNPFLLFDDPEADSGTALFPAQGSLINDIGLYGGPYAIHFDHRPVALMHPDSTLQIYSGDTVSFLNKSMGGVTEQLWEFSHGSPSQSNALNPVVQYFQIGVYDVKLWCESPYGTDSILKKKLIQVKPLEANFSANDSTPLPGDTVFYTPDIKGQAQNYQWFFQGGIPQSSTDKYPEVVYHDEGYFDVMLIASNGYSSDTITKTDYIHASASHIGDQYQPSLHLYPNPVKDQLSIDIDPSLQGNYEILFYNVQGKYIETKVASGSGICLDLEPGIYIIQIRSGNKIIATRRLLVSR